MCYHLEICDVDMAWVRL